jgi:DNA-binding IclR family transcriptional regulator
MYDPDMKEWPGSLKPLAVLEAIAACTHSPTLAELTQIIRQPKPTVHRWLGTLEGAGLIERSLDGRRYELSGQSARLALSILGNPRGSSIRHGILERTVSRVGETCNLTVLQGTQVSYLDRVESHWPLRIILQPGSRVPMHCSASGKLFLALMSPTQRATILNALSLERFTGTTLTDRAALESELDAIEGQNYALDREEYLEGLICLAVPIFQAEGRAKRCVAALALQAPKVRLSCEGALEKLSILRDGAAALAGSLD